MKLRWLFIFLFSLAGVSSLPLSVAPVTAAGLSYREVLHFYMLDGKPQINQPPLTPQNIVPDTEKPTSLDFSADGKTLAVGYRGIIRLWDAATGKLQRELTLKTQPYKEEAFTDFLGTRVRYSPDGRYLAVSAWDEIQIYEGETLIQRYGGFADMSFSWSPDSKRIAGVSAKDYQLQIWDIYADSVHIYKKIFTSAAEWSPDGKYIALFSTGIDGITYLHLLNTDTDQIESTVAGGASVAWSPDSREYVSGAPLRFHTAPEGFTRLYIGSVSFTPVVAWHPSGQRIATISLPRHDGIVTIWDAVTGKSLAILPFENRYNSRVGRHRSIVWDRAGSRLAVIDGFGAVYIWAESGTQKSAPPFTNTPRLNYVTPLPSQTWTPIPPTNSVLKSRVPSRIIRQKTGVKSMDDVRRENGYPLPLKPESRTAISPNGTYIAEYDWEVDQWLLHYRNQMKRGLILGKGQWDVILPAFSPDGRYLAYVESMANVRILDLQTFRIIHTIHHRWSVSQVVWHPTLPRLATLSADYANATILPLLIVYDVKTGKDIYHEEFFAFAPPDHLEWVDSSDTLIMWGGKDHGLGFFEHDTQTPIIKPFGNFVTHGALSPDRHYFAFITYGFNAPFTLHFLDMQTRKIVREFPNIGINSDLLWSPDGQQVFTLDDKGMLTVWGN